MKGHSKGYRRLLFGLTHQCPESPVPGGIKVPCHSRFGLQARSASKVHSLLKWNRAPHPKPEGPKP